MKSSNITLWSLPTDPRPLCRRGCEVFFKRKDHGVCWNFQVADLLDWYICPVEYTFVIRVEEGRTYSTLSASHIQILFIKGFSEIIWHDPEYNLACCTDWNVIYFTRLPDGRIIALVLGEGKDHPQRSVLFPVTWCCVHTWLTQSVQAKNSGCLDFTVLVPINLSGCELTREKKVCLTWLHSLCI